MILYKFRSATDRPVETIHYTFFESVPPSGPFERILILWNATPFYWLGVACFAMVAAVRFDFTFDGLVIGPLFCIILASLVPIFSGRCWHVEFIQKDGGALVAHFVPRSEWQWLYLSQRDGSQPRALVVANYDGCAIAIVGTALAIGALLYLT